MLNPICTQDIASQLTDLAHIHVELDSVSKTYQNTFLYLKTLKEHFQSSVSSLIERKTIYTTNTGLLMGDLQIEFMQELIKRVIVRLKGSIQVSIDCEKIEEIWQKTKQKTCQIQDALQFVNLLFENQVNPVLKELRLKSRLLKQEQKRIDQKFEEFFEREQNLMKDCFRSKKLKQYELSCSHLVQNSQNKINLQKNKKDKRQDQINLKQKENCEVNLAQKNLSKTFTFSSLELLKSQEQLLELKKLQIGEYASIQTQVSQRTLNKLKEIIEKAVDTSEVQALSFQFIKESQSFCRYRQIGKQVSAAKEQVSEVNEQMSIYRRLQQFENGKMEVAKHENVWNYKIWQHEQNTENNNDNKGNLMKYESHYNSNQAHKDNGISQQIPLWVQAYSQSSILIDLRCDEELLVDDKRERMSHLQQKNYNSSSYNGKGIVCIKKKLYDAGWDNDNDNNDRGSLNQSQNQCQNESDKGNDFDRDNEDDIISHYVNEKLYSIREEEQQSVLSILKCSDFIENECSRRMHSQGSNYKDLTVQCLAHQKKSKGSSLSQSSSPESKHQPIFLSQRHF